MTLRRDRRRGKKKQAKTFLPLGHKCSNCGEDGPHFVPPSFGDPGFYMCTPKEAHQ